MGKHHADDKFGNEQDQKVAYDAMINARVTGSIGSTAVVEDGGQEVARMTVDRVEVPAGSYDGVMSSCAWRVRGHDIVIVADGLPGRYKSHGIDEGVVALVNS